MATARVATCCWVCEVTLLGGLLNHLTRRLTHSKHFLDSMLAPKILSGVWLSSSDYTMYNYPFLSTETETISFSQNDNSDNLNLTPRTHGGQREVASDICSPISTQTPLNMQWHTHALAPTPTRVCTPTDPHTCVYTPPYKDKKRLSCQQTGEDGFS